MTQAARHHGTAREAFGLSIRGQLVDFANGARIVAVDQQMRDAIEAANVDVEWDDRAGEGDALTSDVPSPPRRGRPPKLV